MNDKMKFGILFIILLIFSFFNNSLTMSAEEYLGHWAVDSTDYVILSELDKNIDSVPTDLLYRGEHEAKLILPIKIRGKIELVNLEWIGFEYSLRLSGRAGIYDVDGMPVVLSSTHSLIALRRDGENLEIGLSTSPNRMKYTPNRLNWVQLWGVKKKAR